MPVFDIGEPRVDVFLLGVWLSGGEKSVEIRRIRLVLPMVLELMEVDVVPLDGSSRRGRGLECCRHAQISPKRVTRGTGNP
jgi:hypothetical protein